MIVALRGTLVRWDEARSALWLEAGGVTYELAMPVFASEWVASQRVGEEVQVYTYQHATDRLAATIVAHLRGKLVQEALLRDQESLEAVAGADIRTDAIDALITLQYSRREAEALVTEALKERQDLTAVEDVLRHVLTQQARAV